jgi:hypothetical protein
MGFESNEAALALSDAAELWSDEAACCAAEFLRDNFPDWGLTFEDGTFFLFHYLMITKM